MNYFQLYLSPANIILYNYSKIKQIKPEAKALTKEEFIGSLTKSPCVARQGIKGYF